MMILRTWVLIFVCVMCEVRVFRLLPQHAREVGKFDMLRSQERYGIMLTLTCVFGSFRSQKFCGCSSQMTSFVSFFLNPIHRGKKAGRSLLVARISEANPQLATIE